MQFNEPSQRYYVPLDKRSETIPTKYEPIYRLPSSKTHEHDFPTKSLRRQPRQVYFEDWELEYESPCHSSGSTRAVKGSPSYSADDEDSSPSSSHHYSSPPSSHPYPSPDLPTPPVRSSRAASRRPKEPAKYDGTGDFNDFIAQFEIMSDMNEWSYEKQGPELACSLSGKAMELLSTLPAHAKRDYDSLRTALLNRFAPRGREGRFSLDLWN